MSVTDRLFGILPKPLRRFQEQIMYLFFGGLTTVINWIVSFGLLVMTNKTGLASVVDPKLITAGNTALAWVAAVAFAYFTNRTFVFKERRDNVLVEVLSFFAARIMSLGCEIVIMVTFVNIIGLNFGAVKVCAQIFVVVFNYVASKLVIFRKK